MSEKTPIEDFKELVAKEDAVIWQCLIELGWTPPNKWENRFKPGDHAWVDDIPYSPYPHYTVQCENCGIEWDVRTTRPPSKCILKEEPARWLPIKSVGSLVSERFFKCNKCGGVWDTWKLKVPPEHCKEVNQ